MTTTRMGDLRLPRASLPQRALDLLFPPRCVHCGQTGEPLCAACFSELRAPPAPRCERCDLPLSAHAGPYCATCRTLARQPQPPPLDRIVIGARYEGAARSAIHALKYRGQRRLATPLAYRLAEAALRSGAQVDVIIPMPLHSARRRERGYNQATLLARPLARALGAPLNERALVRIRATQPQTRLNHVDRRANVAGAFALAASAARTLAGRRVALVDDVTTTGATLEAAAEALLAAHPAAIYALAVARPIHDGAWPAGDLTPDR